MSYGASAALQAAVYQALAADSALGALVGGAIYDAAPDGPLPETYVSLGPEEVSDASDQSGSGANHDFTVTVVTEASGFATAKRAAVAVSDALVDARLTLERGGLIGLRFLSARAHRVERDGVRRIDLKFRARVEDRVEDNELALE